MAQINKYPPETEQPLIDHLIELRNRLIRTLVVVTVIFLLLFPFANDLYSVLAEPLLAYLPEGSTMIATEVASPFLAPFKFTLVLAFFIAVPYVLYQVWSFIAPGLYQSERSIALPLVVSSTLLFYGGIAFAYYVVFPLVFNFLVGIAPQGVTVMTDISKYLDFVLKMFFAFGVAFEVPVATILIVRSGLTTTENLVKKRPYIIVAAFVIGMFLTPPDVISQTLLAIPMWLLFELGIFFSRRVESERDADQVTESEPDVTVEIKDPGRKSDDL
jgi:sec-independent protein translocase protein TatC